MAQFDEAAAVQRTNFSVVICTRDRARFLELAVDSVLAQEYPKARYELVIVDNNSSDETRMLVNELRRRAPVPVLYCLERRAGASFARNLGIEKAKREYVAFLDDDTVAAPGWLAAFDGAIREYSVLAAGGPVEPVLEPGVAPPYWWRDRHIKGLFGLDHAHLARQPVMAIRWPLWLGGCNSIYSKRLLVDHGGFRTNFGPVGARYRVAEDIDLNARLERAGVAVYYVRDALIKHRITANRLTSGYVLRRSFAAGRTDAAVCRLLGTPASARSLSQFARSACKFAVSRGAARTLSACRCAYDAGYQLQNGLIFLRRYGWSRLANL